MQPPRFLPGSRRWSTSSLLTATAALVMIMVTACSTPPPPAAAKAGEAQVLFRVMGDDGKTDSPVVLRVILRSRTVQAYDVSQFFPAKATGEDIATFFERSMNDAGFQAFRSTRSVFVHPVYEFGASSSHDSVKLSFGGNSADLVRSIPVAKPKDPLTEADKILESR